MNQTDFRKLLTEALCASPLPVRRAYAGKTPGERDDGAAALARFVADRLAELEIFAPKPEEAPDTHPRC